MNIAEFQRSSRMPTVLRARAFTKMTTPLLTEKPSPICVCAPGARHHGGCRANNHAMAEVIATSNS